MDRVSVGCIRASGVLEPWLLFAGKTDRQYTDSIASARATGVPTVGPPFTTSRSREYTEKAERLLLLLKLTANVHGSSVFASVKSTSGCSDR